MAENAILLAVTKIGVALGGEALKLASSLFANEVSLLTQLPSGMRRIRSELLVMQAFLGQIDIQTDKNQVLEVWVEEVRKLANHVEDIMDEYFYLIAQQQGSGLGGFVKKIFNGSQNLIAWHQIAAQVKELETNLQHLSQIKKRWIKMTEGETGSSSNYSGEKQLNLANSSYFLDENELVGIDRNKTKITDWLSDGDPARCVISVCGMGGLGKTTLVASVYKSERKKFDCHAWISISKTYKVDDLLRRMIEELYENEKVEKIPNSIREMDDRRLAESVRRFLENKKYLIILDDVWDPKAFDDIGAAINVDDKNGSRVIITTRSDKVASVARDGQKLQPGLLEKTEAWDLFCKRAFRNEDGKCPQELGKLGEEIVSKCQGLPLAIVSIGSLLSLREKTKSEWQKVYDQLSWQLDRNPDLDHVKRVLNLSYLYLPRYLKNCFLHCSMFPEDDVLQRKRLMRLWVAEGLVEERGSSTMEEVAEDYLEELVQRCMLQVVETNEFGRIKHCRMHDIVRELAVSLSKKKNFSLVIHDDLQMVVKTGEEKRRLSVHKCGNELQSSMELPRLRTFTVFDPSMSSSSSFSSLCSSSKYLTVLDLQGISIDRVPDEIGDLFNLHFLGLRETKVKVLPESLGRLRNLQTLDLFKSEIEKLPSTTENLKKLRHLFAEKIVDPIYKTINHRRGVQCPKGLWNFKDLQTLQAVEANMEFVEQLGNLTQIRSIRIWKVRGIHCKHLCASLSRLRYLHFLSLNASDENEILQLGGWDHPPQHLLKLNLRGRLAEGTMELPLFHALGSSLRTLYLSRPEPNTRIGYVMAAHSLEQALKNMQGQNKSLQSYQP